MSKSMLKHGVTALHVWHILALVPALVLMQACDGEANPDADAASERAAEAGAEVEPGSEPSRCPWSIDALLSEVGEAPFVGRNCGSASYTSLKEGFTCFEEQRAAGTAVLFTVNKCIDCSIPFTYLASASGELFELLMEDDSFGDGQREATVARCAAVKLDAQDTSFGDVKCEEREQLYHCSESRSLPHRDPGYPPMNPRN
jgi:hypothetical protein